MNDHKELIEMLREMSRFFIRNEAVLLSVPDEMITSMNAEAVKDAADAIEQLVAECKTLKHNLATVVKDCDKLVKERDAAITDFTLYVKHIEDGRKAFSCEFCDENGCDNCKHCSNFEWRGVQEE